MGERAWFAALACAALSVAASCGLELTGSGSDASTPDDATARDATVDSPDDVFVEDGPPRADSAADAGPLDGGCDANVATSAKHCGQCGHDCLGGACVDGVCAPVVLAGELNGPAYVAVEGDYVYATLDGAQTPDAGLLVRVPTAGLPNGSAPDAFVDRLTNPARIVVSGGYAYYVTRVSDGARGDVQKCSINTQPCTSAEILKSGLNRPHGVTVSGNDLFFTTYSAELFRCPTAGCAPDAGALHSNSGEHFYGVATEGTGVFFAENEFGKVLRCSKDSCDAGPATLASNEPGADAVFAYGGTVYWANTDGDGAIHSCAATATNCTPTNIALDQHGPRDLVVDDSGVYWTSYGDGQVRTCPLAGCSAPIVLATNQTGPWGIAVDANSVYWANHDGPGQIVKVRKRLK